MVYAAGRPRDDTQDPDAIGQLAAHQLVPAMIETGSAGLACGVRDTFGHPPT